MVEVKLAGMNVPIYILDELKKLKQDLETSSESDESKLSYAQFRLDNLAKQFTPEILSAAYARISRKPEDVNKLVEEALKDVPAARKSNMNIIYGMGHHSVADHAIFNFNIMGVSRLIVEDIEKRRIGVGYTEKSQRYITLGADLSDTVEPQEYSPEDLKKHKELVLLQNNFYFHTYQKLYEHLKMKNTDKINELEGQKRKDFLRALRGSAKEDTRFGVGLARRAQLGCSYPGQTLELAIRTLKYGRLLEGKEVAQQWFDTTVRHAPSLIQLTDPEVFKQHNPGQELQEDNFKYTDQNLRDIVEKAFKEYSIAWDPDGLVHTSFGYKNPLDFIKNGNVTFVKPSDIDTNILAALLHEYSKQSIEGCYECACILIKENKAQDFMKQALKYLSAFDKVPRAFEMSNGLMFEAIISSSCFAQLKRHRMNTLLSQDYNPELGFTIPPNITEIGADKELKEVVDKSSELYYEFLPKYGKAAEYCLTNSHRRRVLIGINVRQLYHVSRTREDAHAQWEIRELTNRMNALAKQEAPITTMLLGGQDEFQKIYNDVYSNKKLK